MVTDQSDVIADPLRYRDHKRIQAILKAILVDDDVAGDVRVLGYDEGDAIALVSSLLLHEQRRALRFLCCVDVDHTGKRLRLGHVDRFDDRMCVRAVQHSSVQHPL